VIALLLHEQPYVLALAKIQSEPGQLMSTLEGVSRESSAPVKNKKAGAFATGLSLENLARTPPADEELGRLREISKLDAGAPGHPCANNFSRS